MAQKEYAMSSFEVLLIPNTNDFFSLQLTANGLLGSLLAPAPQFADPEQNHSLGPVPTLPQRLVARTAKEMTPRRSLATSEIAVRTIIIYLILWSRPVIYSK